MKPAEPSSRASISVALQACIKDLRSLFSNTETLMVVVERRWWEVTLATDLEKASLTAPCRAVNPSIRLTNCISKRLIIFSACTHGDVSSSGGQKYYNTMQNKRCKIVNKCANVKNRKRKVMASYLSFASLLLLSLSQWAKKGSSR